VIYNENVEIEKMTIIAGSRKSLRLQAYCVLKFYFFKN